MHEKFEVHLTLSAKSDIEEIYNYLTIERGTDFAISFIDDLLNHIETLEQFPHRCPILDELSGIIQYEYRQLINYPYKIIFQILDNCVFILLVTDGRRDMQSLLEKHLLR